MCQHVLVGAGKRSKEGETHRAVTHEQRHAVSRTDAGTQRWLGTPGPTHVHQDRGGVRTHGPPPFCPAWGAGRTAGPRRGPAPTAQSPQQSRRKGPSGVGSVGGGQGLGGQTPGQWELSARPRPHTATLGEGSSPELSQVSTEKWSGLRFSDAGSHVMWGTVSVFSPGLTPLSLSSLNFFFFT